MQFELNATDEQQLPVLKCLIVFTSTKCGYGLKKIEKNPSKRCMQLSIRPTPALQKLFTRTEMHCKKY